MVIDPLPPASQEDGVARGHLRRRTLQPLVVLPDPFVDGVEASERNSKTRMAHNRA